MKAQAPHHLSAVLLELSRDLENKSLNFGTFIDAFGNKGYGFVLLILSLPSALPVPAAGYSVPFGVILVLTALQMIVGRSSLWFPSFLRRKKISGAVMTKALHHGHRVFLRMERVIRPRMKAFVSRRGTPLLGMITFLMGLLMCIPIPTTNTVPAMVIALTGIGLLEEDGLFILGACLMGVFAILIYAAILYLAYQFLFVQDGELSQFKSYLQQIMEQS